MKYIFASLLTLCCFSIFAQDSTQAFDTVPPYQRNAHLPKFTILQTDSTYFSDLKLPENKPVIILYFNPNCGHCQITADEFTKTSKSFKDVQFVWASYDSVPEIKTFAKHFFLTGYKNVHIGRDENYAIPSFFRVKFTPFIAVYDRHHELVSTYEKGTDMNTLLKVINGLKS